MKILLINESPYMKQLLIKSCFIEKDISIISTKGFLFNYFIKKTIKIEPINLSLVNYLKKIKNYIIIIGSDHDDAGDFIAFELMEILNNKQNTILRLNINFDDLLKFEKINKSNLLKYSNEFLNVTNAKRYWNKFIYEEDKIDYINVILNEMNGKEIIL